MKTVFGTGPSFNKVQVYGQVSPFGVTIGTKQIFWNLGLGIFLIIKISRNRWKFSIDFLKISKDSGFFGFWRLLFRISG
ncbi:hypothetical protein [Cognataquiflexum rubidum]|uniref:hypothetical protein n=1 Tax=Cognataquiflexum rubidum TaxID=2922273 RepID=UPI001F135F54|nr:hypothetical protein [Cognataquiflexum rubidum]MCH6232926.1 hypothetical protein [Cognataquiflexum rubidum]